MKTKYTVSLAFSSLVALSSVDALALGVGNAVVHSRLNEPLNAELELLSIGKVDVHHILPALAGQEDFERAGLDRNASLSKIQFTIKENQDGKKVVQLTTKEPVKDPFMTVLIEMNWPNGRILREYTLLFDPPEYAAQAATASADPIAPAPIAAPSIVAREEATEPATEEVTAAPQQPIIQPIIQEAKLDHPAITELPPVVAATAVPEPILTPVVAATEDPGIEAKPGLTEEDKQVLAEDLPDLVTGWRTSNYTQNSKASDSGWLISRDVAKTQKTTIASTMKTLGDAPSLKLLDPKDIVRTSGVDMSLQIGQKLKLAEESLDVVQRNNQSLLRQQQALKTENDSLSEVLDLKQKEIEALKAQLTKYATLQNTTQASASDTHQGARLAEVASPIVSVTHPTEETPPESNRFWMIFASALTLILGGFVFIREYSRRKQRGIAMASPVHGFSSRSGLDAVEAVVTQEFKGTAPTASSNPLKQKKNEKIEEFDIDDAVRVYDEAVSVKPVPAPTKVAPKISPKVQDTPSPASTSQVESTLEDAEVYLTFGKPKMAENIIKNILANEPNNHQALIMLLDLYVKTQRLDEAKVIVSTLPASFETQFSDKWKEFNNVLNTVESVKPPVPEKVAPTENNNTMQTKLDLAQVYIEMNDTDSAKELLLDVKKLGNETQRNSAEKILKDKFGE